MEHTTTNPSQEAPQELTDSELDHARNAAVERVHRASDEAHLLVLESIARVARRWFPDAQSVSVSHERGYTEFALRAADGIEFDVWAEDWDGDCFADTGDYEELHQLAALLSRLNWVGVEETYLLPTPGALVTERAAGDRRDTRAAAQPGPTPSSKAKYQWQAWFQLVASGDAVLLTHGEDFSCRPRSLVQQAYAAGAAAVGVVASVVTDGPGRAGVLLDTRDGRALRSSARNS